MKLRHLLVSVIGFAATISGPAAHAAVMSVASASTDYTLTLSNVPAGIQLIVLPEIIQTFQEVSSGPDAQSIVDITTDADLQSPFSGGVSIQSSASSATSLQIDQIQFSTQIFATNLSGGPLSFDFLLEVTGDTSAAVTGPLIPLSIDPNGGALGAAQAVAEFGIVNALDTSQILSRFLEFDLRAISAAAPMPGVPSFNESFNGAVELQNAQAAVFGLSLLTTASTLVVPAPPSVYLLIAFGIMAAFARRRRLLAY